MQRCTRYYFDNNIFWLLCKDRDGKKVDAFNESLIEHKIVHSPKTVELLASPFTLLESISSPHRDIAPPKIQIPSDLIEKADTEDIKEFLLERSILYYSEQPSLKREAILASVENQFEYGTVFGKKLFKSVIAHNTQSTSFEKNIYQALAFDYIQKYPYPRSIMAKMISSFAVDVFRSASYGLNISWARTIYSTWNSFDPEQLKKFQISLEDVKQIQKEKYCFKFNSDYMDTELTHFSTVGWNQNVDLHPVICFTGDPIEKAIR